MFWRILCFFIGAGIGVFAMGLLTQGRIADLRSDNAWLAEHLREVSKKLGQEKTRNMNFCIGCKKAGPTT